MSKFKVLKRLDLSYLGEEWKECYILFSSITFNEVGQYKVAEKTDDEKAKLALQSLEDHFIEGKAIDESGKIVILKKGDLKDLPVDVVLKAVNFLIGEVGKNV
jgi:hypothetical protein